MQYIQGARKHRVQNLQQYQQTLTPTAQAHQNPSHTNFRFENTLPASFMGSRAWASEQVANAFALYWEFGPSGLFITFTTNPTWPEIASKLCARQNASDIPTIIIRVFYARLKKFKKRIKKHFGTVIYMIGITEFQKRGLSHHYIIIKVLKFSSETIVPLLT